jgi:hypothetical protein
MNTATTNHKKDKKHDVASNCSVCGYELFRLFRKMFDLINRMSEVRLGCSHWQFPDAG